MKIERGNSADVVIFISRLASNVCLKQFLNGSILLCVLLLMFHVLMFSHVELWMFMQKFAFVCFMVDICVVCGALAQIVSDFKKP